MGQRPLTRDDALEAVIAAARYVDRGYPLKPGNKTGKEKGAILLAAQDMGLVPSTVRHRIAEAERRWGLTVDNCREPQTPHISPDGERPDPREILRRHSAANDQYIQAKRTKPVVVPVRMEPFAVAFVGDPHMANVGCNLTALQRDMEILRASGVRAVQMGDLLDNFHKVPKLAEKEAQNRMSVAEGLSLVQWLICESGVNWAAHVLGNHDLWLGEEGVALLREWCRQARTRLFDWNARLIFTWEGGQHVIAASHDFKGHSQFNPTHGPGKMALWDGTADTYVAAHRHNHAEAKVPNGWRGKTYQLIRVRGYKDHDSYGAGRAQFADHDGMEGRSALLVVNPIAETHDGRQRVFMDLLEGVEYLEMLKRRAA